MALGATCVQRLDGSRDSAIHTKYRISLRSSSMQEPRYPLPRVVLIRFVTIPSDAVLRSRPEVCFGSLARRVPGFGFRLKRRGGGVTSCCDPPPPPSSRGVWMDAFAGRIGLGIDNDPSAGSPTETLLRLLLPLNDKVQWTSHHVAGSGPPTSPQSEHFTGPFNR